MRTVDKGAIIMLFGWNMVAIYYGGHYQLITGIILMIIGFIFVIIGKD